MTPEMQEIYWECLLDLAIKKGSFLINENDIIEEMQKRIKNDPRTTYK
jgi:hypothetical protein